MSPSANLCIKAGMSIIRMLYRDFSGCMSFVHTTRNFKIGLSRVLSAWNRNPEHETLNPLNTNTLQSLTEPSTQPLNLLLEALLAKPLDATPQTLNYKSWRLTLRPYTLHVPMPLYKVHKQTANPVSGSNTDYCQVRSVGPAPFQGRGLRGPGFRMWN